MNEDPLRRLRDPLGLERHRAPRVPRLRVGGGPKRWTYVCPLGEAIDMPGRGRCHQLGCSHLIDDPGHVGRRECEFWLAMRREAEQEAEARRREEERELEERWEREWQVRTESEAHARAYEQERREKVEAELERDAARGRGSPEGWFYPGRWWLQFIPGYPDALPDDADKVEELRLEAMRRVKDPSRHRRDHRDEDAAEEDGADREERGDEERDDEDDDA